MKRLQSIIEDQSGLISREQVLGLGLGQHDIERFLRRRELAVVHPGVYVDHTGPLPWLQRAWAAALATAPSALCGPSALRLADGPGRIGRDEETIHVAVDRQRNLIAPSGVLIHRMTHWQERTIGTLAPPRLRYEDAALDVAVDSGERMAALGVLAAACQRRRTTAERLRASIDARQRMPMRDWLLGVLDDLAAGSCSVLEQGYLRLVERAHGLPRPERQVPGLGTLGLAYRDVEYPDVVIELDGRLFHDNVEQREVDFDRDLDVAADGRITVRLSYGQVFRRGCRTAVRLARVLAQRGWAGTVTGCGPDCPAG